MTRKIFLTILTLTGVLMLAVGLSACGTSVNVKNAKSIDDYINSILHNNAYDYEANDLSEYDGWEIESVLQSNKYLVMSKEEYAENGTTVKQKRSVYSVLKGLSVMLPELQFDESADTGEHYGNTEVIVYEYFLNNSFISIEGFAVVAEVYGIAQDGTNSLCYKYYDVNGNELVSYSEEEIGKSLYGIYSTDEGTVFIGNRVYRAASDGTLAEMTDYNPLYSREENLISLNGIYITVINVDSVYYICSYNSDYSLRGYYIVPSEAVNFKYFVLNDNSFAMQYSVAVGGETNDYDYIDGETKYKLYTGKLDLNKMKFKKSGVSFIIGSSYSRTFYAELLNGQNVLTDKAENMAIIYAIEDKRINENKKIYVIMDNNFDLKARLDGFIPTQNDIPSPVGSGKYSIETENGNVYIVDASCNILASFEKNIYENLRYNFDICYSSENCRIYDNDFNVIYDYSAEENNTEIITINGAFIAKISNSGGGYEFKLINSEGSASIDCDSVYGGVITFGSEACGFITVNTEGAETEYRLYGSDGELLKTSSEMRVADYDGVVFAIEYRDETGSYRKAYYGVKGDLILDVQDSDFVNCYSVSDNYVLCYSKKDAQDSLVYAYKTYTVVESAEIE